MTSVAGGTLADARRLFEEGNHRRAALAVSDWLKDHPDDAQGFHLLGACHSAVGDTAAAAMSLGRAVALGPDNGDHRVAFAIALGVLGDMERAEREYAAGRELSGSDFGALEFGLLCLCRRSSEEAVLHLEEALEADPADLGARVGITLARAQMGRVDQARSAFAELAESNRDAHLVPGLISTGLEGQGRRSDALEVLRLAHAVGAEDPELPYRLAAAEGTALARAPESYVQSHFDRFAATFDDFLRDKLSYRTPELLVEAAARHLGRRTGLSVLDGGCGTGLCGPFLRPMASRLVGVDLSAGMLDKARTTGAYDQLEHAELEQALAERDGELDLIVCADVLIYLGDLTRFFEAAAGALRPGGVLAVSIERLDTGGEYALHEGGRFAHSPGYVERMSARAGLELLESTDSDIRLERGRWVPGALMVTGVRDRLP
ncbi:MAG TPA: methyltransferase domain-containing protein [Thermoleophilaceae bacterium]|nr:methyltransferase domain-containing protein [Thermoleophilaceae bacterium]